MSQYISSYLIDPVIRQARRFSRSSTAESSIREVSLGGRPGYRGYENTLDENSGSDSETLQQTFHRPLPNLRRATHGGRLDHRVAGGIQSEPAQGDGGDQNGIRARAQTDTHPSRHHENTGEQFTSANASFPSSIHGMAMRYMEDSGQSARSSLTQRSSSHRRSVVGMELPEDDGMGQMRKRILDIQQLSAPSAEKSRLMHTLMMEQYFQAPRLSGLRPHSPSSLRSHERPFTPVSSQSNEILPMESPNTVFSAEDELTITEDERKATYYVPASNKDGSTEVQIANDRQFGCTHYKRNVKLQCSACHRWYTCRFCHDQNEDHCLNRRATRNMLCMACGCPQPASKVCKSCGQLAAWYFCRICKLWDDDTSKSIYHCNDCGICRRGEGLGKDFFHCKTCCACISVRIKDTHKCIERSTDCDCPICGEYMFSSPQTVIFMRCGHSIHHTCWKEHMQNSFKCPICSKSMVNMEITFRRYDLDIEAQPMPPQFRDTKAWIFCNDCSAKSLVKYHWIGLKCGVCDSYNTAQLQIISDAENVRASDNELDSVAPSLLEPLEPLESFTRGRRTFVGNQARASSTSAVQLITHTFPSIRNAQSTSPTAMSRFVFPLGSEGSTDPMDTSDEVVDFWGGESPGDRVLAENGYESVSESSEDEELMVDNEEEDEDEDEDEDRMAIFGHR